MSLEPACPFCGAQGCERVGQWGGQMITAQWRCAACGSYFEAVREEFGDGPLYGVGVAVSGPKLVEFPADDPERARRFWGGLLGVQLESRGAGEGEGWQTGSAASGGARVGLHERGPGPGDTVSLPYFEVDDIAAALARVQELGGSIVHPGERWAICRDSEGSPFALAADAGS